MKAVEFDSTISAGGQISLPPEIAQEIPAGEHLRVVLLWEPSGVDSAWRAAGRKAFESSYCAEDSVYEQLIDDPASR
jgi:hypothetical protein